MGANAQTSVPKFTAAQVLTASQQNLSAATGVPVFATTVTRDAAFGGSNKALAEGQLCYIEASDVVQYYTGAAWATVGPSAAAGLVLITTGTLTAAASVTVDGCFTSTYNNYLLLVDVTSSAAGSLTLQQRNAGASITAANYQWFRTGFNNAGSADNTNANGATSWVFGYGSATAAIPSVFSINIFNPLASRQSNHNAFGTSTNAADGATAVYSTGFRYTASQAFDGFVLAASAGNLTGTVRVYGISK